MSPADRTIFLESAFAIGARLCRDALWSGRRCNWQGPSMEPIGGQVMTVQRTYGPELYNGTSGIAYFLSRLYRRTGEAMLRTTAEAAGRQALSRLEAVPDPLQLGFYSGHLGIAWAWIELGEAFEDERCIAQGFRLVRGLEKVDPTSQQIDVLAGAAGVIPPLLILHRRYGDDAFLEHALKLGDFLIENAHRRDVGWSWKTLEGSATDDLTGFSHGTSGIAWALLELAEASSEPRFRAAALEGFRYERHWYNPTLENWPDLRDPTLWGSTATSGNGQSQTPSYAALWCHGAPGIGLARLRAFEILEDTTLLTEAEAAIRTTIRDLGQPESLMANYSLCHGRAGNAELLLYASQVLGQPAYRHFAENVGRQGLETYERHHRPWPSGVTGGGEAPNLMLGTAGIGHFLLRLHDPEKTPAIVITLPDVDVEPRARAEITSAPRA